MDNSESIRHIWQMVYDMLRGPGAVKTYDSYMMLTPGFEEELLNDIRHMGQLSGEVLEKQIEDVRAKLGVCQATGFIGENDLERLEAELDTIKV